ncbi:hypothetical protein EDD29_2080 [Actinocorallia herbida]|uniref:Uncharacterized protein n=1 Tax=Actinocorallia herbida TaxID=58109 RepID=A0A3N1CTB5_9ACTN|nr:hypothetical protein [Actinocorallia herbida]ROO84553.1 hypothetical protein EDD29_2080 [Actinocorallia herbida]
MGAVEYSREGTPGKDDPQVARAMAVWDALTADEQRELFRSLYRRVEAYRRTSQVDHLVTFADSVEGMVRLESRTDLRQILRARRE